jgi:hypothetical protein
MRVFVGGSGVWLEMPRPRKRVCLESGLKLDLNKLRRQGLVSPGAKCGACIRWTNTYTGEEIAKGALTSNLEGNYEGWLRIQLGDLEQTIILVPKPRHFGGYQWYFVCSVMNRYASVLWMPPGSQPLLQPSDMGQASRLCLAICGPG